jgi:phosphogluconate dehydratase
MTKHPVLVEVTERIIERSRVQRTAYLNRVRAASRQGKVERTQLACANLAHAFAAMPGETKIRIKEAVRPNLAIVSSYNDMLSAHQPFDAFPAWIKEEALAAGATAQFAGGVPAMCDGVTQGLPGMELSLFSRDVIAMSTAVALAHQMFDAALYLGVCDKIIPGLVIGAVAFGHLPAVFVPAGPMPSGISNDEKTKTRQLFAAGKVGNDALLDSESKSYHSPGTCTFYGTANSNQMLMEVMGLHLPGSAFIPPGTPLREALTREAARQAVRISAQGEHFTPVADIIDEKTLVNAIVGLLATGGSTNHTMHLVAIGRAAGINLNWDDYDALSRVVPLLARVYPNGPADINHFHAAGGIGYVIRQLLDAGLLHDDVNTVIGQGLHQYTREPWLDDKGELAWREAPLEPRNRDILRPVSDPFSADGGLKVLSGNIGRSVIKISSIKPEYRHIEAPAIVFNDQNELQEAFKRGELEKDFIAVVRYQGPRANGMPELHRLTPPLGVLLEKGFKVALVTDGRMSGASGKIPAAIHVSPEAASGGPIGLVQTGDLMRLDIESGALDVIVDAEEWAARKPAEVDLSANTYGVGRELFAGFRAIATTAEEGATSFALPQWENK